ncbi:MAG: hypothetical protein V2G33_07240 [bacterium JZ-2024 1]
MVLCGGMGREARAFSGPEEKPADTSSRKVEGFYPGCRWIASPKDIPVPEEVLKRIERLRGGPMIESEKDIQILISEWQKDEFRRLSNSVSECSNVSILPPKEKNADSVALPLSTSGSSTKCCYIECTPFPSTYAVWAQCGCGLRILIDYLVPDCRYAERGPPGFCCVIVDAAYDFVTGGVSEGSDCDKNLHPNRCIVNCGQTGSCKANCDGDNPWSGNAAGWCDCPEEYIDKLFPPVVAFQCKCR